MAIALRRGYPADRLREFYNPSKFFDEVYLFSPFEEHNPNLFGMKSVKTEPEHLKKMIKKFNIDVVRAYGGHWACDMACRNKVRGIPVAVSVHAPDSKSLFNSIKMADIVFCTSNPVRNMVLTRFRKPNRVWLLPNRVDFNLMRPHPKNELIHLDKKFPFKYRILHIGRKSEEKNLDTVIKALKILGKDYCLLAVGSGNKDEYVKLAKEQGVIDQCYFINVIKNVELPLFYSWADCLCNPSKWEGFGIIFIEALACEAIVVTSDIAPMNEFIKHKVNGLLVKDYESPEDLAELIKIACTDPQVRAIIKANARRSVEKFDKNKIDALEAEYYKKILIMKRQGKFNVSFRKEMIFSIKNFIWLLLDVFEANIPKKIIKNIPKQLKWLYKIKNHTV